MMEIAVMGDEYFVAGFESAGVKNAFVVRQNADEAFEQALQKEGIGILITDKKAFDGLSERHREKAMTLVRPTVVILSHDVGGEENLRLMIKRSLGIDLWGQ